MRGASAASLASLTEVLGAAVDKGESGEQLASDLFGMATLLSQEPGLRRVVTDASVDAKARSGLVSQVFSGKVGDGALEVLSQGAALRWASTGDLGKALEQLAVVAVVKGADKAGQGDALQDDLFGISRLVSTNPALRDALSDPARSATDKRALLKGLLDGKVTPAALALVEQALSSAHRTVVAAIEHYTKLTAANRNKAAATVRVARPLSDADKARLESALTAKYGKPVHTNVVIDPELLGGIKVEIGDDVIDGTIASRLEDAGRRLAG
ncbi:MAG TPA: F0F1 ATP synthase subunit delta [Nocardioidaceae bacterium]|nr:F0F1 ATP synthase subunit delta [Nocardioidaceae bacterium]